MFGMVLTYFYYIVDVWNGADLLLPADAVQEPPADNHIVQLLPHISQRHKHHVAGICHHHERSISTDVLYTSLSRMRMDYMDVSISGIRHGYACAT